jgi:hypothetical protein
VSKILFVFALFFLALSFEGCWYEVKGGRTTGVVIQKLPRASTKGNDYVRYRFTTGDGQTLEGRADVLPQNFARLREGGPVEVEYIRDSPGTNRVPGQRAGSYVWGLMAAAALAGGVVLRRRERRKAAKPAAS